MYASPLFIAAGVELLSVNDISNDINLTGLIVETKLNFVARWAIVFESPIEGSVELPPVFGINNLLLYLDSFDTD